VSETLNTRNINKSNNLNLNVTNVFHTDALCSGLMSADKTCWRTANDRIKFSVVLVCILFAENYFCLFSLYRHLLIVICVTASVNYRSHYKRWQFATRRSPEPLDLCVIVHTVCRVAVHARPLIWLRLMADA